MSVAIIFDRSSLGLGDLTITDNLSDDYVLAQDGLGYPGLVSINSYASSGLVHGDVVVRSRLQEAEIPVDFYVKAASAIQLRSRLQAVGECLFQFAWTMNIAIDDSVLAYACDPSAWQPSIMNSGLTEQHKALVNARISVYPLANS